MKALGIAAGVLALAAAAMGADFAALEPQGYVSDFARVIPQERRVELERYCKAVETATGVQIALVTLPALDGEPVEDVANVLYRKWGVGHKGKNEGALLLISIGERRTRLEVGYGLEPVIPDGYAGSLLREMRPALKAGDIGGAMAAAAQALGEKIAAAKGVAIGDRVAAPRPHQGDDTSWGGLVPLLIAGGVLLAVILLGGGGSRRGPRGGSGVGNLALGMLVGMLSSSRRTYGGGGFGGYDSGDSFGGFGGGDSGGGGASSDW
jgi:uncharacterized protein